ncbi:hypothetical protein ACLOJK_037827 [Asimina triloba]
MRRITNLEEARNLSSKLGLMNDNVMAVDHFLHRSVHQRPVHRWSTAFGAPSALHGCRSSIFSGSDDPTIETGRNDGGAHPFQIRRVLASIDIILAVLAAAVGRLLIRRRNHHRRRPNGRSELPNSSATRQRARICFDCSPSLAPASSPAIVAWPPKNGMNPPAANDDLPIGPIQKIDNETSMPDLPRPQEDAWQQTTSSSAPSSSSTSIQQPSEPFKSDQ